MLMKPDYAEVSERVREWKKEIDKRVREWENNVSRRSDRRRLVGGVREWENEVSGRSEGVTEGC